MDLAAHLQRQQAWSRATFGSGARHQGVIGHIEEELQELRTAAPEDCLEEWIDIVILALDGALRCAQEIEDAVSVGAHSYALAPSRVVRALLDKQEKNELRDWPDWRTKSQDEAIGHVKVPGTEDERRRAEVARAEVARALLNKQEEDERRREEALARLDKLARAAGDAVVGGAGANTHREEIDIPLSLEAAKGDQKVQDDGDDGDGKEPPFKGFSIESGPTPEELTPPSRLSVATPVSLRLTDSRRWIKGVRIEGTERKGGRFGRPRFIILHYTANGSIDGTIRTFRTVEASSHLIVGRGGVIVQMVPFDTRAWHAGKSQAVTVHGVHYSGLNEISFGIEMVNYGYLGKHVPKNVETEEWASALHPNGGHERFWQPYPLDQVESVRRLCLLLMREFEIPYQHVLGHDEVSPDRKVDPGPAFRMEAFRRSLREEAEE